MQIAQQPKQLKEMQQNIGKSAIAKYGDACSYRAL
jgi:hypothetical protein